MTEENWQQIRGIFDDALRRKPDERSEFVRVACAGKDELRAEVESLLASLDSADSTASDARFCTSAGLTSILPGSPATLQPGQYRTATA